MEIEQHIQNLKDYIRIDKDNINYDDSDFAQFCKSHCEDIQAILDELENRIPTEAIEKKIQEYKGLKEIDMQAYEEQIRPLKELLNKE